MMEQYYKIIKRPVVTEQSTEMNERNNKVVFEVAMNANKLTIKKAVEVIYGVKVEDINTAVMRGKMKRIGKNFGKRANWKKAIVTLKDGDTIDFFANV